MLRPKCNQSGATLFPGFHQTITMPHRKVGVKKPVMAKSPGHDIVFRQPENDPGVPAVNGQFLLDLQQGIEAINASD
eukprot:13866527-Alexandrium_andersonii.AAC.1